MGQTAKELVAIAKAEIGYHEKATNANLNSKTANSGSKNYQKYGRDLYAAGYYNGNKNGFDWCDQFVDWCFFQLCGKNKDKAEYMECQTGSLGAGCGFSMQYYKTAGRFDKTPKVGDQIFFKYTNDNSRADHTGIVVSVTAMTIQTVEGNSGNKVSERTYNRNYYAILGYGHPRYAAEDADTPTKPATPISTDGRIDTVKEVQLWLNRNYAAGLTLDGLYGSRTKRALTMALQKELGVAVDGIYGKNTNAAVRRNNLQQGNEGALVRVLQGFLVCHSYKSAYVDGEFGEGTEMALKSFQKVYKLSVDGIAGTETFSTLCS